MNCFSISAFILIPLFVYAQNDSTKIKENPLRLNVNSNEKIDTSRKEIKQLSILHLKVLLDSQLNNLKINLQNKDSIEDEFLLYDFSKEELNSGLSKKELITYMKNKKQFNQILQQKYDEGWWYRVKSLGQLLGVPELDWLIKWLEFALLLAL